MVHKKSFNLCALRVSAVKKSRMNHRGGAEDAEWKTFVRESGSKHVTAHLRRSL